MTTVSYPYLEPGPLIWKLIGARVLPAWFHTTAVRVIYLFRGAIRPVFREIGRCRAGLQFVTSRVYAESYCCEPLLLFADSSVRQRSWVREVLCGSILAAVYPKLYIIGIHTCGLTFTEDQSTRQQYRQQYTTATFMPPRTTGFFSKVRQA